MANIKFTNFAHSLLAVGIGPGDTSISVTGGHGVRFPALGAGEYFYATLEDASNNREIVKVTARATDVLTVVRAQDNTSALSWNAGDTIALRLNAAAITDFVDTVVNTVAKTSSTGSAVVPSGTVAQRDGSPVGGYFRHNTDNTAFEGYVGAAWREFVLRTSGTGSLLMPSGTTAQRDGSPAFGYTRANSTLTQMEWWNGTTWASFADQVTSLNGGQLAGMRNKIINGAMQVDQRNAGASQSFTAGAALAYCVDRWYGFCTGANITGQRVALANGQNRYRFTGAASNTGVGFGQRIEAVNCLDLAGSTATLSVKLSSSSLTSITWTAYYATTTDAFGTLASPTRTQIATGTFTINSTEATYSASISVPSAATTGIEIVFTGGALLGTQTLTIGDVQLEVGSVATPFEHRPYGAELALCQRYYEVGTYADILPIANANITASYYSWTSFAVTKRATPTITGTNGLGTFDSTGVSESGVALGRSNVVANRINSGTYVASIEL